MVYSSASSYVLEGFCSVLVFPSPKSQFQLTINPLGELVSVNVIESPIPIEESQEKLATTSISFK